MKRIFLIPIIFYLSLILLPLITHLSVFAQKDNTIAIIASNKSTNAGILYNGTGIMQNTSGIIDDAIYALKESFRSLFGK